MYVPKQSILEKAGLLQLVRGEVLDGTANGTNKVFQAEYGPFTDANYDDDVDTTDVTVYVAGVKVAIASIDPDNRTVTLLSAPANGASVTADYVYSNVSDTTVSDARDEAEDLVNETMDSIDAVPYDADDIPPTVKKIVKWYAAGILLMQDYGPNQDTEQTSKNGDYMMKRAEAWLDKYVLIGGVSGLSTEGQATAETTHDDDIFGDPTRGYSADDLFMRDLGNDD